MQQDTQASFQQSILGRRPNCGHELQIWWPLVTSYSSKQIAPAWRHLILLLCMYIHIATAANIVHWAMTVRACICLQKNSGRTAEPGGATGRQPAADGTERQKDKQEDYHKLVHIRVKRLCVSRARECILRVTFDRRSAPSHQKASPYTYRNRRHTPDTALMLQTTCTQL